MNNSTNDNIELRELHGDNKYKPLEEEVLFRPLSRRLAKRLKNTKIHPDHVSLFGFILTAIVGILFFSKIGSEVLIAILLFLCLFFDKLDGDLARAKGIAGRKGQYVDGFLDVLGEMILIIGIAKFANPPTTLAMLSIVSTVLFVYHGVSAPFYLDLKPKTHLDKEKRKPQNHLRDLFSFGRAKFFILIIILTLFGRLELLFFILPLLVFYTILIFLKNIFVERLAKR